MIKLDDDNLSSKFIHVDRQTFNNTEFEEKFKKKPLKSDNAIKATLHYCYKNYKPSRSCSKNYLLDRLPIIKWMRSYNFKENIVPDTISGLTIGLIHLPQGLAYAQMADLPPVTGLYVSLFSVLVYVILGTSNHLSIGTFAITSLMTRSCFVKFEGKYFGSIENITNNTNVSLKSDLTSQYLSQDISEAKVLISTCLTLFTGIFHVRFTLHSQF